MLINWTREYFVNIHVPEKKTHIKYIGNDLLSVVFIIVLNLQTHRQL